MGLSSTGEITLIDEIHTPDSNRYWIKDSFEKRMGQGMEPENIERNLRLGSRTAVILTTIVLPEAPEELVVELSARYIHLYETITGKTSNFLTPTNPFGWLNINLKKYL